MLPNLDPYAATPEQGSFQLMPSVAESLLSDIRIWIAVTSIALQAAALLGCWKVVVDGWVSFDTLREWRPEDLHGKSHPSIVVSCGRANPSK